MSAARTGISLILFHDEVFLMFVLYNRVPYEFLVIRRGLLRLQMVMSDYCKNAFSIILVEKTCNEVITANSTFFVNPGDTRSGSSCSVSIQKVPVAGGICQLRLDLLEFESAGPNFQSGMCLIDTFSIGGIDNAPPVICGSNDRQHSEFLSSSNFADLHEACTYSLRKSIPVYVDVRSARHINLMMNLGFTMKTRRWKIKVTQIPCYSSRLAPPDCLQYYEEASGYIKSFNYGSLQTDAAYQLNMRLDMPRIPWEGRKFSGLRSQEVT